MGLELDQPSTLLKCVLAAEIQVSFDCPQVFHIYSAGPDIHCDNDIIQWYHMIKLFQTYI